MQIFGVDFSGASDGGKHIWIAGGKAEGETLQIESCERASDRWGNRLEPCLASLVENVAAQGSSAFGFDFPFGLPKLLLDGASWLEFVLSFGSRYSTPESFREECWRTANGHELKRLTDLEAKTPFCVYNLRIYRTCPPKTSPR